MLTFRTKPQTTSRADRGAARDRRDLARIVRERPRRIIRFDRRICVLAVAIAGGLDEPASGQTDAWTPDEVVVARHCVSERSFAESNDCRVIAWIDRRNAERRRMTIGEWMARAHSTHLRSPSRPWIAELDATGRRRPSWPDRYPWEPAREVWLRTLAVVRAVLAGGSHGCNGTPLVWGSPRFDRGRLDRWYARGYVRLRCGATRNEIVGTHR